ncbi:MAG: c-type cytochrome [Chitinophagaceae bacterium]|nr:c-type cytochrome [Chitinophagaceae bacterium]
MRKLILIPVFATILFSCGGGDKNDKPAEPGTNESTETSSEDLSDNPVYKKGLALVGSNDCLTCHRVDELLTGPSYRDIANKYGSMSDTIISHLAGKIIAGGNGVWGDVFMTPHAGLSKEDAEAMVEYILLLKNK